jgi:hypothetical protein
LDTLLDSRIPHNALAVHCSRGNDREGGGNGEEKSVIPLSHSVIPATERKVSAGSAYPTFRHSRAGGNPSFLYIFSIPFSFAKSKALATIFLEQARKRQRTCHAVVSSLLGYPRIFILLGRCGTQLLLFTTTTLNKSSRFILAKSKIHRRHKCVGLRNVFYVIASLHSQ